MQKARQCRVCEVPRGFSRDYKWNSDGTATMRDNPDLRNIFCETEGIEELFHNINSLLGTDISPIIAEGKRKFGAGYLAGLFSNIKGVVVRTLLRRHVYKMVTGISPITGYGDFSLLDYRRGKYVKVRGRNIYCLPLLMGDLQAVFEVIEGRPGAISLMKEGDAYIIEITPGDFAELEFESRLELTPRPRKPGDIEYRRCPECDLPLDFRGYDWDLQGGVITGKASGRNMALIGLESLQSVFRELETELGEDIPRAIMEAQRRYVRRAFTRAEVENTEDYLFHQLALRGMGNLVRQEIAADGLEATIENGSPPPMVAGWLQGVSEVLSGKDSGCDYEVDDEGTLAVSVKAR